MLPIITPKTQAQNECQQVLLTRQEMVCKEVITVLTVGREQSTMTGKLRGWQLRPAQGEYYHFWGRWAARGQWMQTGYSTCRWTHSTISHCTSLTAWGSLQGWNKQGTEQTQDYPGTIHNWLTPWAISNR